MATTSVSLRDVTLLYPGGVRPALSDVNVDIESGEMVFLTGASGSGKSSILRLVLRESVPSIGAVHALGEDLGGLSPRGVALLRRRIGTVFQDYRLLPERTVSENVAFALEVIDHPEHEIWPMVTGALDIVGLSAKAFSHPSELSGGEQQRVAIARAVVGRPAILLADEPTGSLDPATGNGVMDLLATINAMGTTVVVATHDRHSVDRMQRRVVTLGDGRVLGDHVGGYDPAGAR